VVHASGAIEVTAIANLARLDEPVVAHRCHVRLDIGDRVAGEWKRREVALVALHVIGPRLDVHSDVRDICGVVRQGVRSRIRHVDSLIARRIRDLDQVGCRASVGGQDVRVVDRHEGGIVGQLHQSLGVRRVDQRNIFEEDP